MCPVSSIAQNLLSGLAGALFAFLLSATYRHLMRVREKREDVTRVLRKARRKVELEVADMNDCFAVFKEYRDAIEDSVSLYASYLIFRSGVDRALRDFCGYAKDHPYRNVHKMPETKDDFLDRLDALELAVGINDSPTRHPRPKK